MEVRTSETECCINKSIIRAIPWAAIKTYSASRQLWPPGLGTHSRGGCSAYETYQHFPSLWWALNDRGQTGVRAAAVRAKGFFWLKETRHWISSQQHHIPSLQRKHQYHRTRRWEGSPCSPALRMWAKEKARTESMLCLGNWAHVFQNSITPVNLTLSLLLFYLAIFILYWEFHVYMQCVLIKSAPILSPP